MSLYEDLQAGRALVEATDLGRKRQEHCPCDPEEEEVMDTVPQIYYVLWSPALLRYYGARDTWVTDVAHARTFGIIGDAHMARDALKSAGLMREVDVFRVKVTLERV